MLGSTPGSMLRFVPYAFIIATLSTGALAQPPPEPEPGDDAPAGASSDDAQTEAAPGDPEEAPPGEGKPADEAAPAYDPTPEGLPEEPARTSTGGEGNDATNEASPDSRSYESGGGIELGEPEIGSAPRSAGGAPDDAARGPGVIPAGHSRLHFQFGDQLHLSFAGKLKVGYSTLTPDRFFAVQMPADEGNRVNPYVGRNDGFGLGEARFYLRASYGDLFMQLVFDGAFATYQDDEDLLGQLETVIKDAYLRYTFHPAIVLSAGRFKVPYIAEDLISSEDQYFTDEALECRGVARQEGWYRDMPGFCEGRHIGVMAGSPDLLDMSLFTLGYAVAITNGTPGMVAFNDNDLPAVYARIHGGVKFGVAGSNDGTTDEGPATVAVREGVFAGVSFKWNERTFGEPPNRQSDQVLGIAADLQARLWYVVVQGQLVYESTDQVTFEVGNNMDAFGGHAQLSVEIPGLGLAPGYRFAVYDPVVPRVEGDVIGPDDQLVQHHTIGLRWTVPNVPLVAWLEYTHSAETGARAIPNDRVQAAVQVTFE